MRSEEFGIWGEEREFGVGMRDLGVFPDKYSEFVILKAKFAHFWGAVTPFLGIFFFFLFFCLTFHLKV